MKPFFHITQNALWGVVILLVLGSSYLIRDIYMTLEGMGKPGGIVKANPSPKVQQLHLQYAKPGRVHPSNAAS